MPTGSVLINNSKKTAFKGYITAPAKGVYPGILLLHQEYGLDAAIRSQAEILAALGHIVFVPNLFWREMPDCELNPLNEDDLKKSKDLISNYNLDDGFSDITVCLKWLRETPQCNGLTATIGYGFSSNISYMAGNWLDIESSVCFGLHSLDINKLSNEIIRRPMMVHVNEFVSNNSNKIKNDIFNDIKNISNINCFFYNDCNINFARLGDDSYNEKEAYIANNRTYGHLRNSFKKPYNT